MIPQMSSEMWCLAIDLVTTVNMTYMLFFHASCISRMQHSKHKNLNSPTYFPQIVPKWLGWVNFQSNFKAKMSKLKTICNQNARHWRSSRRPTWLTLCASLKRGTAQKRYLRCEWFQVVYKPRPQLSTESMLLSSLTTAVWRSCLHYQASVYLWCKWSCVVRVSMRLCPVRVVHLCHRHYIPARLAGHHVGVHQWSVWLRCRIQRTDVHSRQPKCSSHLPRRAILVQADRAVWVTDLTHVLGGLLDSVATRYDVSAPTITIYDAGRVCLTTDYFSGLFQGQDQFHLSCQRM